MEAKHTEGPWYFDGHGAIWRRPPSDLYENGGEVAGDRPIATVHKGWHHDGANGYPVEANARLIAAAPIYYEAGVAFREYESAVAAGDDVAAITHYSRAACILAEAHAKATGEQP